MFIRLDDIICFIYRSKEAIKSVHDYCEWRLKRGLHKKRKSEDTEKIEKWRQIISNNHKYQGH